MRSWPCRKKDLVGVSAPHPHQHSPVGNWRLLEAMLDSFLVRFFCKPRIPFQHRIPDWLCQFAAKDRRKIVRFIRITAPGALASVPVSAAAAACLTLSPNPPKVAGRDDETGDEGWQRRAVVLHPGRPGRMQGERGTPREMSSTRCSGGGRDCLH